MSCPPISKDLLEHLQRVFPNKLPEVLPPYETVGQLIGQQKVIAHLEKHFAVQNRTAILGPT